ncbi:VOC family protein [Micrococcus sp. EYE_162]|uniref:VOC family protein n=1 Tax=unclassified Micrococcus TaxID=2620948 RepID=UPI002006C339|nr:VOC family protein [Micrococcus sp. EYE_212]MCK6171875.1 VOC family protein [Micrococcus sp. EYE_162]
MNTCRMDHVSYAAGPEGLEATVERLVETLGIDRIKGGVHPRFGTHNALFPMRNGQWLEVVEAMDHPASLSAPFGQLVRARSEQGGGWMSWAVSTPDIGRFERRLEREAVPGIRRFPDGRELSWRQIGIKGTLADPQLPYILRWADGQEDMHPSQAAEPQATIEHLNIAGSPERLAEWLGGEDEDGQVQDVNIEYVAPSGTPGIVSVTFTTPAGPVTL